MDLLLWIYIGFVIIGLVVLAFMKKGMERKLALIAANTEVEESSAKKAKSIIWWIGCTAVWGIVSMIVIVWWFHTRFG